ncbi:MAG: MBL fold metallo-hydrolase, partial [Desulfobacterales bacterium]|nr:MBL fold metallo-hydrolase [Desulfobacterales bacterium]
MHLTFYGAVREVTGSMHLLATDTDRVLLDCGMFQGRRKESEVKNQALPFDPRILTNMVLSHAHIDHSGRIPLLTKRNFQGRIFTTRATRDAAEYLLLDSAGIQESDANYLNYKTVRNALAQIQKSARAKSISKRRMAEIKKLLKKGPHGLNEETINELITKHHLESVRPLYTVEDAEQALEFFDGYPYRSSITIGRDMTCKFYDAGHILGSAINIIKARENGRAYTIAYTGDLGRFDKPILRDPVLQFSEEDREVDLLVMESTYGNRLHDPPQDMKPRLKKVLTDTLERGGTVMIPAFAYGRAQELIYVLHELYDGDEVPKVPIYVDSPLSTKLTRVFAEHPEVYDRETHEDFLEKGENPFRFDQIRFVASVEESIALV